MCGIAGFTGSPDRASLDAMMSAIRHRGPDDCGSYVQDGVNLGHLRLSIIDLSTAGRQPMSDAAGQVWLSFNGEIYNFRALRRELEDRYTFRTATDSEAIIAAYLVYGRERFLDRLDGMFAFALWDVRDRTLLVARDRVGIKPLYWARIPGGMAFASEVRALIRHPEVPARLSLDRLPEYLALRFVHNPQTALEGVEKLRPGHALIVSGGAIEERRYWMPDYSPRYTEPAEATARLREAVGAAVESHLVADVPVAVMLSGGVDSSIIATCAARAGARLKTFSIGFAGEPDNEFEAAADLARRLGADHQEITVSAGDVGLLPHIAFGNDEPVAGPSSIAYFLALAEARKSAKVILFGHGADEIFSGYEQLKLLRLNARVRQVPGCRMAARVAAGAGRRLFPGDAAFRRLSRFLDADADRDVYALLTAVASREEAAELLYGDVNGLPAGLVDAFGHERDPETAAIRFEQNGWLPDDILHRVDRMTMVHSLEGRVPFLDRTVVECANAVANPLKLNGSREKHVLREAFRAELPQEVVHRRKQRFNTPIHRFFGAAYERVVRHLFSADHYLTRDVFRRDALVALLDFRERPSYRWILSRNKLAAQFYARQIWGVVVYMLWAQTVVDRRDPAEIADEWAFVCRS